MMRTRFADEVLEIERELNARFGVNAAAFDAEGARVTNFVAWSNPLCKAIKTDPASGSAICAVANGHFMREARHSQEPVFGECDAGFIKFCVPVVVDGAFIGMIGGCGCLPPDGAVDTFTVSKAASLSEAAIAELAAPAREFSEVDLAEAVSFLRDEVRRLVSGT